MTDRRRTDGEDCTEHQARNNGLEFGYKGFGLKARGSGIILAIAVLAIMASNIYGGYLVQQAMSEQHRKLTTSQDRTSCMVSIAPDEREKFRREYRIGAFKQWCPWVDE